jgi:glycosyltransferase involved in cell wall biosynthesis
MRLAFVVQRYGLEVSGGAELLCRQVAERLASRFAVEVLTTCAQDYLTWKNVYPAGPDTVNGVQVRRYPTVRPRETRFRARALWLYSHPHSLRDELDWLCAQGPLAPALLRHIAEHRFDYDAFIFFTYIYYPTALGLRLVADRALLVPTAHNEPPLHLAIYDALFRSPRAILYNTVEEKRLLEGMFGIEYIPNQVVGVGITVPKTPDPGRFLHRYGVHRPYVVYVGRVSVTKYCHVLLGYFERYKATHPGPLTLVLVGRVEIPVPSRPDVIALGVVSEQEKFDAMAGAELLLLPSEFESLSIAFLESLAVGTPVLCNGTSDVLRGHCLRSNAALYYDSYPEFEASMRVLTGNGRLRRLLGQRGQKYVEHHYDWEQVVHKYEALLDEVLTNPWY